TSYGCGRWPRGTPVRSATTCSRRGPGPCAPCATGATRGTTPGSFWTRARTCSATASGCSARTRPRCVTSPHGRWVRSWSRKETAMVWFSIHVHYHEPELDDLILDAVRPYFD